MGISRKGMVSTMAAQDLIRIHKALSEMGVSSRRKAEEYIQQGRVKVNGHPAVIGMKVNPAKDIITLDDERITVFEEGRKFTMPCISRAACNHACSDELEPYKP
jgi:23S rRNA pseudouridine2605 synthase